MATIPFSQLTEYLKYPPQHRALLQLRHSDIVLYVKDHFVPKNAFKNSVIKTLNSVSYYVLSGDTFPIAWPTANPVQDLPWADEAACEALLRPLGLYLTTREVYWDIDTTKELTSAIASAQSPAAQKPFSKPSNNFRRSVPSVAPPPLSTSTPTQKEHLYIKYPAVPQFDRSRPWLQTNMNQRTYTIYKTLPAIPTVQSEISVTTDVNMMSSNDLLRLYPNCFIKTRAAAMYDEYPGLTCDPDVGVLLKISGFTDAQIRDNIIKYPHFYKLTRMVQNKLVSFYTHIEIDGVLHKTLDVWDSLPDSEYMPRNSEFIKEYVVRRYLLERDLQNVKHVYPMFGTLDPFLTLFTTAEEYVRFGYPDTTDIARKCVESRVSYKQSRNPIIRMVV